MASSTALFCARHETQASTGSCRQCGNPYCGDCRAEDVATEESFCSSDCRDEWRTRRNKSHLADNHQLLADFATPIRSGWRLWIRSIPVLTLHALPLGVVMTAVTTLPAVETISGVGILIWPALASFGVALTQMVMTQKHSGLVRANPYLLTAKRFVPWVVTTVLAFAILIVGYMALIIPGIYLSLRLFWAEEFVLVHGTGPLQGLRESWELTRGSAGSIFGFQFLAGFAAYGVLLLVFGALAGFLALVEVEENGGPVDMVRRVIMFWGAFIAYAGLHAPEVVYIYGMRAERAVSSADSTKTLGL